MKTFLRNLRYLWHYPLDTELDCLWASEGSRTVPGLEEPVGTPVVTLFTGKHHVDILSTKAITHLTAAGIKTVEQLREATDYDLMRIKGLGRKTRDYIKTRLFEEAMQND